MLGVLTHRLWDIIPPETDRETEWSCKLDRKTTCYFPDLSYLRAIKEQLTISI